MKERTPTINTSISRLRYIPAMLVATRVLLGPILFLIAMRGVAGGWLVLGLTAAFLSDIFDGILARRIGVATERLRVADSWADGWFYVWVILSVYQTVPKIIHAFRVPLLAVIALQLFSYSIDLIKYRRIASFHAYTAKAWGISLFVATIALLGFHTGGVYLWAVIVMGVLSNIDGLAIKTVLPEWRRDVPSVFHALKLRRREGRNHEKTTEI